MIILIFTGSYISVLDDSKGNAILFIDMTRQMNYEEKEIDRSAFYSLSRILSDYDVKDGITLLLVLSEDNFEWALTQTVLSRLRQYFPIHFSVIHVVVRNAQYEIMRYPVVASRILGTIIGSVGNRVHMHSGTNATTNFARSLERAGLFVKNLPLSLRE
jgi:hypothetical protein